MRTYNEHMGEMEVAAEPSEWANEEEAASLEAEPMTPLPNTASTRGRLLKHHSGRWLTRRPQETGRVSRIPRMRAGGFSRCARHARNLPLCHRPHGLFDVLSSRAVSFSPAGSEIRCGNRDARPPRISSRRLQMVASAPSISQRLWDILVTLGTASRRQTFRPA